MRRLVDYEDVKLCVDLAIYFDMTLKDFRESMNEWDSFVDLVRCKDCMYGEKKFKNYKCWMLDEDWDISFSPMHFCSYGRRREDGEE